MSFPLPHTKNQVVHMPSYDGSFPIEEQKALPFAATGVTLDPGILIVLLGSLPNTT